MYNWNKDLFSPSNMIVVALVACTHCVHCNAPFTLISFQFCQIFNVAECHLYHCLTQTECHFSVTSVFFVCFWH
jgi:hypothetical protein